MRLDGDRQRRLVKTSMKNLVLLCLLIGCSMLNAQNPMFKMNILKTNALYYIKQPSYGHYTQNYILWNGLMDISLEKRVAHKNYFGIGINYQGRVYDLNFPNTGANQRYKTHYTSSLFSYYLKYNFHIDSGKSSNTYVSFAAYMTRTYNDKTDYYNDTIMPNSYTLKNRSDFESYTSFAPVIGINNEYRMGNFVYFRSGLEFIPAFGNSGNYKNNSRLSMNLGIQLRFY